MTPSAYASNKKRVRFFLPGKINLCIANIIDVAQRAHYDRARVDQAVYDHGDGLRAAVRNHLGSRVWHR